ncbi:MAG: lysostaphin resistance A-like protein [Acutalibacteraceae bacterium]
MWKKQEEKAPIAEFLGWVLFLSLAVEGLLFLLEPWSIRYAQSGQLTAGYILYAVLGICASTPSPFLALWITLRRAERISFMDYCKRIVATPKPMQAVGIVGFFCALAFGFALLCGTPNGAPWYKMPLGFLVMILCVGIGEEPGWRGFLQPELEKRFPFPIAVSFTAVIWFVWHLPVWVMPSSNHYGDSLPGFAITIFVWAFVAAAIYKATKSTLACAVYHAFINSIGAVYDWNSLFDAYPKTGSMIVYHILAVSAAVAVWMLADKREKAAQ